MNRERQNSRQRRPKGPRRVSNLVIVFVTLLSTLAAVVLAGGFVYGAYTASGHAAGSAQSGPQAATGNGVATGNPASVSGSVGEPSGTIHLLALGDSLTHGFGDASGKGYVGDVVDLLRRQGRQVSQTNLGIDGLTSEGLVKELQQAQVARDVRSSNVIFISIGGNDLNNAAGLPNIHLAKIASAEKQFQHNLNQILGTLQGWNPKAVILLVGLYNPYGDIVKARTQTNDIVSTWNQDELSIVSHYPHAAVVQTYDLFQLNPTKYLYVDHFHPNEAGYSLIATRIWQDLQGTFLFGSTQN